MSLSVDRFDEFFHELWGYDPFPWQSRLAKQVFDKKKGWPDCLDLPTASGKTACIDIALFVLACQAGWKTKDRTVGRRIFFTVNRRVIVDEAFKRSSEIQEKLFKAKAKDGILKEVADALRKIGGDKKAPPLDVAQLRGGIYRDRAWARSITQPIVACTTADQLGSRLLFRGYGVSASSAPIHAALCGCDSLVLLDEAHVTRAFSQTMQLLPRYQAQHATAPKMRFVQMTATPSGDVKNRFELDRADRSHPILKARQKASKSAELVKLEKKKPIVGEIVDRAFKAVAESPRAVGIIVNRVQTAREIARLIQEEIEKQTAKNEKFQAEAHLVIGRMRPLDRDDLQATLGKLIGPGRPEVYNPGDKSVFVVATQCLEVGADYDFDVLLTECAALDALRQRFGRLNRRGRAIEAVAAIVTNEESLKGDDPIYGDAIKHTWDWLWAHKDISQRVDFGIAAFGPLWEEVEEKSETYLTERCPKPLLSPSPNAAVLLPAHLDALCQTNPQPVPSPDVSYFIHGPQRDNTEVNVCWRADLGEDEDRWPDIVRMLPPTTPECMTVPLAAVKSWMGERFKAVLDADVPTAVAEPADDKSSKTQDAPSVRVVVWRFGRTPDDGDQKKPQLMGFVTADPRQLKPGDTIVMPVYSRSWLELGHIPSAVRSSYKQREFETKEECEARCAALDRTVDVAERATRRSRLRLAIRLHEAFPGRAELRSLPAPELRPRLLQLLETEIADDDKRRRAAAVVGFRFDRHSYDIDGDDRSEAKHNELIVFRQFLEPPNLLEVPTPDEDDGEDDLSEGVGLLSLDEHTKDVEGRLAFAVEGLHLNGLEPAIRKSATHHDLGKADLRFQAMLAGITPYEAMMRPTLLGKGDGVRRAIAERNAIFERAMYPRGFRHEMLSVELVEYFKLESKLPQRDLLLHLIAAHHGYARPFAPVCIDEQGDDELRSVRILGKEVSARDRKAWAPSHRLDSGIAERFWKLTREHGWWGLAWLEAILRLADQQASAAKQERTEGDLR